MLIKRIFSSVFRQSSQVTACYKKMAPESEKYAIISKKIKTTLTLQQALSVIQQNFKEFQQKGVTSVFQFFNDYSYSQVHLNPNKTNAQQLFQKIHSLIGKFENLSFFESLLKLSILQKLFQYNELNQNTKNLLSLQIQQCTTKILQHTNSNQLDLYNGISMLSIYKIQQHPLLVVKALTIINDTITTYQSNQNMLTIWSLIIFQMTNIQWSVLRKYDNLIKFLTDDYHLNMKKSQLRQYGARQLVVSNIIELCKLSLHKVGFRRIPIFLKQAIQLLTQQIQRLSPQIVCNLLSSLSTLPLTFYPKFKIQLIKKIASAENHEIKKYFPYQAFSNIQLNKYFSNKHKCNFLFHKIIYLRTQKQITFFYRGQIINYFQQFIQNTFQTLDEKGYDFSSIKNSQRYCHLAYIFHRYGKENTLNHLKKIIKKYIKQIGLQNILNQYSFTHILTLLIIYQKDQLLSIKIKQMLQIKINKERHIVRYERYILNALQAIEIHCDTKSNPGKQLVLFFIKQLTKISNKFDFAIDRRILFSLLNSKQCQQYLPIKQQLLNKIQQKDLQCLIDYFILHFKKTFLATQQIIKKMIYFKVPMEQMIKFLSSISSKYIQNHKGKLETNLSNYLLSNKQSIKNPLLILDQLNKVLSLLINYNFKNQFIRNIYITTLQSIYHYISNIGQQPINYPIRLIIEFLFKFQQIIPSKQLTQTSPKIILKKLYNILQMLIKDDTLYIKTRLLQFYFFFKQYIQIKQPLQIQLKFYLTETLKSIPNPSQLSQIYFYILQLSCFQFLQLQPKQQIQYITIISQSIKNNLLSIRQIKKFVKSTLYHMSLQNINHKSTSFFQKNINQLFISALNTLNYQQNHFNTLKPFTQYFNKVNQIQQIQSFCLQSISNSNNPQQIEFFLSRFPYYKVNTNFLQTILNKLTTLADILVTDSSSLNILFYLQLIFFQTPQKYNKYYQQLWNIVNRNIKQRIQKISNGNYKKNYQQKLYLLGRYPFYMFLCIKTQNTQQNSTFQYLQNFIKQNPIKFINKIISSQFNKSINNNILKYIYSNQIIKQHISILNLFNKQQIFITNINIFSQQLKKQLINQNIQFKFKWKIGKVIVPCFLPQQRQVILITKYHKQNNVDTNISLNGFHKFQFQIAKKLLPGYKIRIYNDTTHTFIST